MNVLRIAAFSYNGRGGNPAGVVMGGEMPTEEEMLQAAKRIGYSETAFLTPAKDYWRVRYFAPEKEVEFCGHATIAIGAVLAEHHGEGTYRLILNQGEISVSATKTETGAYTATLQSPATWSAPASQEYVDLILKEFNLSMEDLDANYPIRFAFAGVKHLILVLREHNKLAEMSYPFNPVKNLMMKESLTTISLLWEESSKLFHSRNPFAAGGVYEDPATGAAAAALAGYLRDIGWEGGNSFDILQGEDMGTPSLLGVQFTRNNGEGIKVSGETRYITDADG